MMNVFGHMTRSVHFFVRCTVMRHTVCIRVWTENEPIKRVIVTSVTNQKCLRASEKNLLAIRWTDTIAVLWPTVKQGQAKAIQ